MDSISTRIKNYVGKNLSEIAEEDMDILHYVLVNNIKSPAKEDVANRFGYVHGIQSSPKYVITTVPLLSPQNLSSIGATDATIWGNIHDFYRKWMEARLHSEFIDPKKMLRLLDVMENNYTHPLPGPHVVKLATFYEDQIALPKEYFLPEKYK